MYDYFYFADMKMKALQDWVTCSCHVTTRCSEDLNKGGYFHFTIRKSILVIYFRTRHVIFKLECGLILIIEKILDFQLPQIQNHNHNIW